MYGQILAPLDGSKQAEQALTVAGALARKTGGAVTAMRVISDRLAHSGAAVAQGLKGSEPSSARRSAMDYLEDVSQGSGLSGVPVNAIVRNGVAAEEIIAEADRSGSDLIVISHRRHAPTTTLLFGGSVADQLMRQARVPVLVLHAENAAELIEVGDRPVRALVPLDGTPFGQEAIAPAIELLRALDGGNGCALHLTLVIDPRRAFHYDTPETEEMRQARDYLEETVESISADPSNAGITVTWAVETDPEAVTGLGRVAERAAYGQADRFDVIAMASHGREGMSRLLSGSVTEALAHKADLPVLVVHPAR